MKAAGAASKPVKIGWNDGIYYSAIDRLSKGYQRSHAKKRPFVVKLNYEQGTTGAPKECDVNFANWLTPYHSDEKTVMPNIYAPESLIDFSYRMYNVPGDLLRGRGTRRGKPKQAEIKSNICVTETLKKDKVGD
jgi:hypothetical protein